MSVQKFDCNKIKRTFWPFTMKDTTDEANKTVKGQTLLIRMPGKGVFERIKEVQQMDEDNPELDNADGIYNLLSEVLSNNMQKKRITAADLEDYDIEECTQIINAYMGFVDELKNDPN